MPRLALAVILLELLACDADPAGVGSVAAINACPDDEGPIEDPLWRTRCFDGSLPEVVAATLRRGAAANHPGFAPQPILSLDEARALFALCGPAVGKPELTKEGLLTAPGEFQYCPLLARGFRNTSTERNLPDPLPPGFPTTYWSIVPPDLLAGWQPFASSDGAIDPRLATIADRWDHMNFFDFESVIPIAELAATRQAAARTWLGLADDWFDGLDRNFQVVRFGGDVDDPSKPANVILGAEASGWVESVTYVYPLDTRSGHVSEYYEGTLAYQPQGELIRRLCDTTPNGRETTYSARAVRPPLASCFDGSDAFWPTVDRFCASLDPYSDGGIRVVPLADGGSGFGLEWRSMMGPRGEGFRTCLRDHWAE